ncbi:MAG: sensor histidine kinase [Eubacteriales bacterium]|nr:sensor histidine kinase [Eubacteriales bacterium]
MMIKKLIRIFLKYKIWLVFMFIWNMVLGAFLWIMDAETFPFIFSTMLLGCAVIWAGMGFWIYRREEGREELFREFLENPDMYLEELIAVSSSHSEKEAIRNIAGILGKKDAVIRTQESNIREYEEYIEKWAHEIKTPLSLMTFILDNRREELSPEIYRRLEYVRTEIQEDIEKMLFYARLKSAHTDYFFTLLNLDEICREAVAEYRILMEEMGISVINQAENILVLSDERGLMFILRQILSNCVKYMSGQHSPVIRIMTTVNEEEGKAVLTIRDNGTGVKPYDLPFIFDKGFTGDKGRQEKSSTGMGLYLARQAADNLKIELKVSGEYKDGFEISLLFPQICEKAR